MKGILLLLFVVIAIQIKGYFSTFQGQTAYIPYPAISAKAFKPEDDSTGIKVSIELEGDAIKFENELNAGFESEYLKSEEMELTDEVKLSSLLLECVECPDVIADLNKVANKKLSAKEILNVDSLSMRVGLMRDAKDLYFLVVERDLELSEILDIEAINNFLKKPF